MEIGVDEGVNSLNLRRSMHPEGQIFLIDPFCAGRLGVNFSYLVASQEVGRSNNGRVSFVGRLSHEASTELRLTPDLVFIDGDHTYTAVLRDWQDWSRMVQPGGLVALHDSRMFPGGRPTADWGPVRLANEIVAGEHCAAGSVFDLVDAVDSITVFMRRA